MWDSPKRDVVVDEWPIQLEFGEIKTLNADEFYWRVARHIVLKLVKTFETTKK